MVVIPKSVHENRIVENINVFDFMLSEEDQEILRKLDTKRPLIGTPENPELVESAMKW